MAASGIKSALQAFDKAVVDITTLEVRTFTGNVEMVLDANGHIDWSQFSDLSKLGSNAQATGTEKGDVILAAATRVAIDFHTTNFQSNDPRVTGEASLFTLHQETLQASLQARASFIGLFKDLIP